MKNIYVKIEYLCYEDKIVNCDTIDSACIYAQRESKGGWVNYCKVYCGKALLYTYDYGRLII